MTTTGKKQISVRTAAMAGVARRALGLTTDEASRAIGLSKETLNNFETATYFMSDAKTAQLFESYLEGFRRIGVAVPPGHDGASIDTLVERTAVVLLLKMSAKVSELVGVAASGGLGQVVDFVIEQGLRPDTVRTACAKRMRQRFRDERFAARQRVEGHAETSTV